MADNVCGQAAAWGGDFEFAALLVAEVAAVKEATGSRLADTPRSPSWDFAAGRPRPRSSSRPSSREPPPAARGTAVQYAHWANSVLRNGLGRYEEALAAAVEATESAPQIFIATWALTELIEAASRTGNAEQARDALARLGEQTEASGSDWPLGIYASSRALLSEGEDAERLHREAIDRLGRTRLDPTSRVRISCTGSGCAARVAAGTRALSCERHTRRLWRSGWRRSPERAQGVSATRESVRKRSDETRDQLTPRGADRPARPGRPLEPGDRRATVPQRSHD